MTDICNNKLQYYTKSPFIAVKMLNQPKNVVIQWNFIALALLVILMLKTIRKDLHEAQFSAGLYQNDLSVSYLYLMN